MQDNLQLLTTRPPLKPKNKLPDVVKDADLYSVYIELGTCNGANGSCYYSKLGVKLMCTVVGPLPVASSGKLNLNESGINVNLIFSPFSSTERVTKSGGGTNEFLKYKSGSDVKKEVLIWNIINTFKSIIKLDSGDMEFIIVNLSIIECDSIDNITADVNNCMMMALCDAAIPVANVCGSITAYVYNVDDTYCLQTAPPSESIHSKCSGSVTITCAKNSQIISCDTNFHSLNSSVIFDAISFAQQKAISVAFKLNEKLISETIRKEEMKKQVQSLENASSSQDQC